MSDFQIYITLSLVWLVSVILVRVTTAKIRSRARLPPSPVSLPIIGHLHLMGPIPHQALHKLSVRYGPLIHIFLGSVPCVVASSPDMAREFMKTHESSFSDRPKIAVADLLSYGSSGFLFSPDGPYWKFIKKLSMSRLLGGRTLERLRPVREEEIRMFLELVLKKARTKEAVDVGKQLLRMNNNILSRMIMSQRSSSGEDGANQARKVVRQITVLAGEFNFADFIWFCKNFDFQGIGKRTREAHVILDNLMERVIKEHQEARRIMKEIGGVDDDDSAKDLLDILLDISEDENSEMKLTKENIKAVILDLFVAGTDTSSITLEWALAELNNHPHIMEKARQEIDSAVGYERLVTESDIINLPYLQAIVKETLRLHPAGTLIVRESSEDCIIGGYDIPARTRLFINVGAIGRDPNYWKNPLEFSPERFINGSGGSNNGKGEQVEVRGQHFQMLPFGSGRRGCPGTSLALQVMQTCLAAMIQSFEWKVSGNNGRVDMEEGLGLSIPRANPLICVPVARLSPFTLL